MIAIFFFSRMALLIGFCQFCAFIVLLMKRPQWVRAIGKFLQDMADVVDGPSVRRYRVKRVPHGTRAEERAKRENRHRGTRKGGLIRCDKQLVDPGSEVLNELTSALVWLGASNLEARQAAALAMRSGVQDFDTLLRAALQEAARVS